MELRPISVKHARAFVTEHHRHHDAPRGAKFCLAAWHGGQLVGVAMVGRPVSRMLDNGTTAEVIRVATDGTRNACSFLYGRLDHEGPTNDETPSLRGPGAPMTGLNSILGTLWWVDILLFLPLMAGVFWFVWWRTRR
jgi:hypothetical protein